MLPVDGLDLARCRRLPEPGYAVIRVTVSTRAVEAHDVPFALTGSVAAAWVAGSEVGSTMVLRAVVISHATSTSEVGFQRGRGVAIGPALSIRLLT